MDLGELGQRLRYAREFRGLSQQATADAIGVTRTAITQMESGNRSVSTMELARLAECFRRPIGFFFQEAAEEKDIFVALYRVAPELNVDPTVREQVWGCLSLFQEGVALKEVLGLDSRTGLPTYDFRTPRTKGEAITQGNKAAVEERRRLGLSESPVRGISELIVSQGVWASDAELPNGVSGLFLNHISFGLAIVVNANHSRGRKKFSYAHEYAHALMDRNGQLSVSSSDNSSELVEVRANAFAASFLIPADGVYEIFQNLELKTPYHRIQTVYDAASGGSSEGVIRKESSSKTISYKDVAQVAHRFGVSYQAALYRLKSLKLLTDKETDSLKSLEGFGKQLLNELNDADSVERKDNIQRSGRELRFEVANLAIEAYRQEEISQGRLLELSKVLKIDGPRFLDLAAKARGD